MKRLASPWTAIVLLAIGLAWSIRQQKQIQCECDSSLADELQDAKNKIEALERAKDGATESFRVLEKELAKRNIEWEFWDW